MANGSRAIRSLSIFLNNCFCFKGHLVKNTSSAEKTLLCTFKGASALGGGIRDNVRGVKEKEEERVH